MPPHTPCPTPCLVDDKVAMANLKLRITAALAAPDPRRALARVSNSLTNLYDTGAISQNVLTKIDLIILEKEVEQDNK